MNGLMKIIIELFGVGMVVLGDMLCAWHGSSMRLRTFVIMYHVFGRQLVC